MAKRRYAQVGIGGRSNMFTRAITQGYADACELVGFCDTNSGRMRLRNDQFGDEHPGVPTYAADDFDRMVAEQKPDVVVVTTVDCFHHKYICRAMELGCDAITEKPMTTHADKCQQIVDTVARTGRDLRVTFNYRYSPPRSQVKELLCDGVIGKVLSVDFHWLLDTHHGADYYRRWHRRKENSGGLLVHKATHHFDLVNWWISSVPVEVFCMGKRDFYVPATADRLGLQGRSDRCHTCAVSEKCPFFLDLSSKDGLRTMYLEQEHHDGYFRDRCVFGGDINIEDVMSVTARYRNGVQLSYSLNSFCAWEGYTIAFNGTKGRLEHNMVESAYVSGDGTVPHQIIKKGTHIHVLPMRGDPYDVEIRTGTGGHGGGDPVLLDDVFLTNPKPDPLKRAAGLADGAYSILTGVAANTSIETGAPVRIDDLVKNIPDPDHPAMKED